MNSVKPTNPLHKRLIFLFGSLVVFSISLVVGVSLVILQSQTSTISSYYPAHHSVRLSPTINPAPLTILTYTSPRLGLRFRYAQPSNNAVKAFVKEINNKIYLYFDKKEYTSTDEAYLSMHGYYLEVFYKDLQDSLVTAIQKQLLRGNNCFVRDISSQVPTSLYPPHYQFAEMDYKQLDIYQYNASATCPSPYTRTNDIAYFLADRNYPGSLRTCQKS